MNFTAVASNSERGGTSADVVGSALAVPAPRRIDLKAAYAFAAILTFSWSSIRIAGISVFDLMSLLLLPAIMFNKGKVEREYYNRFLLAIVLMILAIAISATRASILSEHAMRGFQLIVGLSTMTLAIFGVAERQVLSLRQALWAVFLSIVINSTFVFLQGRFGIATFLMPANIEDGWWVRPSGLGEHPVETAVNTSVGLVLGLYLLWTEKRTRIQLRALIVILLLVCLNSMMYSASLTAVLSLCGALLVQLILSRRFGWLLVAALGAAIFVSITLAASAESGLAYRIHDLFQSGSNYGTVQIRDQQMELAMSQMTLSSLIFGNGFSLRDLPTGTQIHNGVLASLYHFGLLGLAAQLVLIANLLTVLPRRTSLNFRATFCAVFLIFMGSYMTSPSLTRRSIWLPILTISTFSVIIPQRRQNRQRQWIVAEEGRNGGAPLSDQLAVSKG